MGRRARSVSELRYSNHLPGLDGLRALAVGVVIAYHAGFAVPGDLGVTAFFVLSGFLITWLLLNELETKGGVSLRGFYVRRTLRIFPAYYAFVAFSMLTDAVFDVSWTGLESGAAVGYWVNYYQAIRGAHDHPIAHAWSLGIEEQFYLLWPLLFITLARRGIGAVRFALVVGLLAVLGWRSWLYLGLGVGSTYVYNAFDTRLDSLAIGCALALFWQHPIGEKGIDLVTRSPVFPLLTILAVYQSRVGLTPAYHNTVGYSVDAALCGLLIMQVLGLRDAWSCRWLEHPAVRYLGRISYPLYLWHQVGLDAGKKLPLAAPAKVLAGVVACVALASASWHFLERPCLRLRSRFSS